MKVAIALITRKDGRILITQRSLLSSHGGVWEFPGGKLEPFEAPEVALIREVTEEVGLFVSAFRFLGEIEHTYHTHSVRLYGYHVHRYWGEAYCREAQMGMQWVTLDELSHYSFPRANQQLIQLFVASSSTTQGATP